MNNFLNNIKNKIKDKIKNPKKEDYKSGLLNSMSILLLAFIIKRVKSMGIHPQLLVLIYAVISFYAFVHFVYNSRYYNTKVISNNMKLVSAIISLSAVIIPILWIFE